MANFQGASPARGRKKAESAGDPPAPEVDVRGRISIHLDGQDYILRPSWEAVEQIEQQLGPAWELAQKASRGSLCLHEMAVVAAEMMRAQGRTMKDGEPGATGYRGAKVETLKKLIYEAGSAKIGGRLMVVLLGTISGGYTPEGEAKPPATG